MANYIIIDGGTTNTRINLSIDNKIVDTVKLCIGASAGIGNAQMLKDRLKVEIQRLLKNNNLAESDVTRIVASGMITSEFGLYKVEHINAPAGINELHNNMVEVVLSDISDIPFVFIPGIKLRSDDYNSTDMMRGEETEIMGIMDSSFVNPVYVLPGSHSKIIKVDNSGTITDFSTMLTGEMIYSLSNHTILKDAVDLDVKEFDKEYLMMGYECCKNNGINKALFKVRILKNVFGASKEQTYSFFMGVCLSEEIGEIINSGAQSVVIGGKSQIKNAISYILTQTDNKKVITLDEDTVDNSTAMGAIRIYERN